MRVLVVMLNEMAEMTGYRIRVVFVRCHRDRHR